MKKALLLIAILSMATVGLAQSHNTRHHGTRRHFVKHEISSAPKAPEFLEVGDKIAVISPSSVPGKLNIIDSAKRVLEGWGFSTVEGKYARTNYRTFAGTAEQRCSDLLWALRDPSVKAIICTRGGYGSANVLTMLPIDTLKKYPKWIVGYSDVTGYLSAEVRAGNMSIHGNMCGHLADTGGTDQSSLWLRDMLMGKMPRYEVPGNVLNHPGKASGILVGGNMCVYGDIADTPYDFLDHKFIDNKDIVLFIEEVGEPFSRIDRMFQHLILRGVMDKIKALIVGRFDDCKPSRGYNNVWEMIEEYAGSYNIPVCYDFPVGHDENWNYPLMEGCPVTLNVAKERVTLEFNLPK